EAASAEIDARLRRAVPGGAHTYAKGSDQYPVGRAPVIETGHGCRITDVDGHEYIEWGMGLRAVTLGHGFEPVADAVADAARRGTNFVRPSVLELEAAEAFVELVPGADMVKFTKDGSTANTAAVKLARAATRRSRVALCREHPFFSYDDWFMATTAVDAGIPAEAQDESVVFAYNDLASLEQLFDERPGEIACVILEPARIEEPLPGYLESLQSLTSERGAVLIFDECITGFRWDVPGAQTVYGVTPDLSTFGKGLANGFALSALAGRRELMEQGGLEHDGERVFLLSTTHGAEHVGLAAGLATWQAYGDLDVIDTLSRVGRSIQAGVAELARHHKVADQVTTVGHPACLFYTTRDADGEPSQEFRTLFLQETIRRGVLAPSFVSSYSHDDEAVARTLEAVDGALAVYARALEDGVSRYLEGRAVQPVYRRYNRPPA
ncbi:MAG: glutamate-1-semialdehyde 2,1-aminomutase, partial [Gaiellaceae bacterium]